MGLKLDNIPKGFFIAGGLILLVLAMALIGYMLFAPQGKGGTSSAKSLAPKTVQSGGVGGEGTPAYNQMIDELNKTKATEAANKGESFVPIPIGDEQPVVETRPVVQEKPKKEKPDLSAQTAQRQQQLKQQTDNKAMLNDLKGIMARSRTNPAVPVVNYVAFEKPIELGSTQSATPILTEAETKVLQAVKPGDLLYAINDLALTTDAPSPVMATVAMGPLKGSKVIGEFQRHDTQVIMAFSRLILPTGEQLKVEAMGVDPTTSSAAIASNVNTHFFSRWGSLIAASFIEGFGSAMSNRKSTAYSTGDVVVQSYDKSYSDVTLEAMGKVGGRIATQVERNFDRPPTVFVNAGEPIGVLILSLSK